MPLVKLDSFLTADVINGRIETDSGNGGSSGCWQSLGSMHVCRAAYV